MLDETLEVLTHLAAHEEDVNKAMSLFTPLHTAFQLEMDQMKAEVKSHKTTVRYLLHLSNDLGLLVSVASFC